MQNLCKSRPLSRDRYRRRRAGCSQDFNIFLFLSLAHMNNERHAPADILSPDILMRRILFFAVCAGVGIGAGIGIGYGAHWVLSQPETPSIVTFTQEAFRTAYATVNGWHLSLDPGPFIVEITHDFKGCGSLFHRERWDHWYVGGEKLFSANQPIAYSCHAP